MEKQKQPYMDGKTKTAIHGWQNKNSHAWMAKQKQPTWRAKQKHGGQNKCGKTNAAIHGGQNKKQ